MARANEKLPWIVLFASLACQARSPADNAGTRPPTPMGEGEVSHHVLTSPSAYDPPKDLTAAEKADGIAAQAQFALNLRRTVVPVSTGNTVFSPHSVRSAFAVLYAGSAGETSAEIAEVFRFTSEPVQKYLAWSDSIMRTESPGGVNTANAIWPSRAVGVQAGFLDLVSRNYWASVHAIDFMEQPEGARKVVNEWVSSNTEGRIRDLMPPGSIERSTRMVLTNAAHFKGQWRTPFDKALTRDGTFTTDKHTMVNVPTMSGGAAVSVSRPGYEALAMDYSESSAAFVVILPTDWRSFDLQAAGVEGGELLKALTAGSPVRLELPRFSFSTNLNLAPTLKGMGLKKVFSDADFSALFTSENPPVQAVIHKAFIAVDENGTEAAAATGVTLGPISVDQRPWVKVAKPFHFLIVDKVSGTIVFMGQVTDPSMQ